MPGPFRPDAGGWLATTAGPTLQPQETPPVDQWDAVRFLALSRELSGEDPLPEVPATPTPWSEQEAIRRRQFALPMPDYTPPPAINQPEGVDPGQLSFADSQPYRRPPAARPSGGFGALGPMAGAYRRLKGYSGKLDRRFGQAREDMATADEKRRSAMQESAQIEADVARDTAAVMRGQQEAAQEVWSENSQRVGQARDNASAAMDRYQNAMDKYSAMQVQPGRVLSSTGNKILAVLSVALYELGSSAGSPNRALQMIQSEIDRDIQQQEAAIGRQRNVAAMANTSIGMARQAFGDAEDARTAAYNMELKKWQDKIGQLAAQSRAPQVLAKANELAAGLDADRVQNEQRMFENQFKLGLQAGTAEMSAAGALAGAMGKAAQQPKEKKAAPPGLTLIGEPTKDDAKKAKEFTANFNRSNGAISELIKWREAHGAETLDRRALRQGKALTARAIIAMKRGDEMGANFTEMEKELVGLSDDPGEIGFYLDKLRTIRASVEREARGFLKPYGYDLAGSIYKDKGGRISQ